MSTAPLSNREVLAEMGRRVQAYRLNQNLTQAAVAGRAGVSLRTLQNFERGKPGTLAALVAVLRALERLDALDSFLPEPGLSPLQLAKLKGHQRQRASARKG